MLEWDQKRLRNHAIVFLIGLFFVFLFYSNDLWQPNQIFSTTSFHFDLPEDIQKNVQLLGLILPYIVVLILLGMIFFYYARFIKSGLIKFIVRLYVFIFLFFGLFQLFGSEIFNIQPIVVNDQFGNPIGGSGVVTTGQLRDTSTSLVSSSVAATDNSPITASSLDLIFNVLASSLLLFLIGVSSLAFIFFRSRPKRIKSRAKIIKEDPLIQVYNPADKARKQVITNYLEVSEVLEKKGANPDFALTPKEFENDVENQFSNNTPEFHFLTDMYKLARFSDLKISNESIKDVDDAANQLKTRLSLSKTELKKKTPLRNNQEK